MSSTRFAALSLAPLVAVALPLSHGPQETAPASASNSPEIEAEVRALFDYDADADLDIREVGVESFDGYERIDLTYASPMQGRGELLDRVPAYLYLPHEEGPWAGMLFMHGMPGDRSNLERMLLGYVRGGAACLAISAPWARVGPTEKVEPITFTEEDRTNQIQLIQDLRRGIDLLLSFGEVDATRLGYMGGSYGGAMGGLLAGVEERIAAYALVVGDGGLYAHMTSPGDVIPPEGLTREAWEAWERWMKPIEPMRFVAHAAPAHLLFQNGRADELVPAADAREYQEAGSEPKTCLWYDSGHAIDRERLADQALWFEERIGIDPREFVER